MITLTALIKSFPGEEDKLKPLLLNLVAASRKETACLQYDLHQVTGEPNLFIFHEIWESAQKLEEHNNTPHLKTFLSQAEPLLAEPVRVYITNKIA